VATDDAPWRSKLRLSMLCPRPIRPARRSARRREGRGKLNVHGGWTDRVMMRSRYEIFWNNSSSRGGAWKSIRRPRKRARRDGRHSLRRDGINKKNQELHEFMLNTRHAAGWGGRRLPRARPRPGGLPPGTTRLNRIPRGHPGATRFCFLPSKEKLPKKIRVPGRGGPPRHNAHEG